MRQSFFSFVLQVELFTAACNSMGSSRLRPVRAQSQARVTEKPLKGIVPSAMPGATNPFGLNAYVVDWLTLAGLWIGAAYFFFRMSKAKLPPGDWRQEVK